MSILSKLTGVHISPHGASLSRPDPIGAAKDVIHNPLPVLGALALPGVGGLLGAIPGIGGALASGAGAIGGALSHIPGAQSIESILGGGGGATAAGASAIPDAAMGLPTSVSGGGGVGGLIGKAGSFLTGNGGKNALGVAQGISSVLDQQKANNYAKDALGTVEGSYAQRAPLRAQGVQQLLASQQGSPYAGRAA